MSNYKDTEHLLADGKLAEARGLIIRNLKNPPEQLHAMFWKLSVIDVKLNQPESALEWIEKALEIHPENADYHSEKGVIFHHLGKNSLALISLNRSLKLDPANPYRYSSRAYIKDALKDIEGAIRDYQRAIELDPADAVAYNNLGLLQEKLGWKNQAVDNFQKADQLSEESMFFKNPSLEDTQKMETTVENEQEVPQPSAWRIIMRVLVDKKERKEYFRFLKKSMGLGR